MKWQIPEQENTPSQIKGDLLLTKLALLLINCWGL